MMINNYNRKISGLESWNEHVEFWKKVLNRSVSAKTMEQLIVDTNKYYFITNKGMKLHNGERRIKSFDNPYLHTLLLLDYKLCFFKNNPKIIGKHKKILKESALSLFRLKVIPFELLDYFHKDIMWDYYTISFTFDGKEYDETIRKTYQHYDTEIFGVREFQSNLKFLLLLRKISVGLIIDLGYIKQKLMIEEDKIFYNEDFINAIIDYILTDVFDLSLIRAKYFTNAIDFINEREFKDFFNLIKSSDELSLYLVAK